VAVFGARDERTYRSQVSFVILSPSRRAMFQAATLDAYDAEKKGTGLSQALG
jgi:hypothetical protein